MKWRWNEHKQKCHNHNINYHQMQWTWNTMKWHEMKGSTEKDMQLNWTEQTEMKSKQNEYTCHVEKSILHPTNQSTQSNNESMKWSQIKSHYSYPISSQTKKHPLYSTDTTFLASYIFNTGKTHTAVPMAVCLFFTIRAKIFSRPLARQFNLLHLFAEHSDHQCDPWEGQALRQFSSVHTWHI